jgi:hypothetical protein
MAGDALVCSFRNDKGLNFKVFIDGETRDRASINKIAFLYLETICSGMEDGVLLCVLFCCQ